jgi:hypothetical protein
MANVIYPKFKEALMGGEADVSLNSNSDTTGVFVALLKSTYVYSSSHLYYSELSGHIIGTPVRIPNCTVTNGVLDGDDVTFTAVPADTVEKIVLYRKNTGADSTWRLVAYFDSGLGNVPYTTDGSNLPVQFNPSGILKL